MDWKTWTTSGLSATQKMNPHLHKKGRQICFRMLTLCNYQQIGYKKKSLQTLLARRLQVRNIKIKRNVREDIHWRRTLDILEFKSTTGMGLELDMVLTTLRGVELQKIWVNNIVLFIHMDLTAQHCRGLRWVVSSILSKMHKKM